MPIYGYKCQCGNERDVLEKMSSSTTVKVKERHMRKDKNEFQEQETSVVTCECGLIMKRIPSMPYFPPSKRCKGEKNK